MNNFSSEYRDLLSGRIPKFIKTTAIWPKIEVQRYNWKHPFKEDGYISKGNSEKIDEITIQVSTIYKGSIFLELYTIVTELNKITVEEAIDVLKKKLTDSVQLTIELEEYRDKNNITPESGVGIQKPN